MPYAKHSREVFANVGVICTEQFSPATRVQLACAAQAAGKHHINEMAVVLIDIAPRTRSERSLIDLVFQCARANRDDTCSATIKPPGALTRDFCYRRGVVAS
jgi:hypothetical protein